MASITEKTYISELIDSIKKIFKKRITNQNKEKKDDESYDSILDEKVPFSIKQMENVKYLINSVKGFFIKKNDNEKDTPLNRWIESELSDSKGERSKQQKLYNNPTSLNHKNTISTPDTAKVSRTKKLWASIKNYFNKQDRMMAMLQKSLANEYILLKNQEIIYSENDKDFGILNEKIDASNNHFDQKGKLLEDQLNSLVNGFNLQIKELKKLAEKNLALEKQNLDLQARLTTLEREVKTKNRKVFSIKKDIMAEVNTPKTKEPTKFSEENYRQQMSDKNSQATDAGYQAYTFDDSDVDSKSIENVKSGKKKHNLFKRTMSRMGSLINGTSNDSDNDSIYNEVVKDLKTYTSNKNKINYDKFKTKLNFSKKEQKPINDNINEAYLNAKNYRSSKRTSF